MEKKLKVRLCCLAIIVAAVFSLLAVPSRADAGSRNKSNPKKLTMVKGNKVTVTFTGSYTYVKWKSSAPSVASVSRDGVIRAKKAGKAKLTANVSGTYFYYAVTVEDPALNYKKLKLEVGEARRITIKGTKASPQWKSSLSSVASVDAKGNITAKHAGTCTIYTYIRNKLFQCRVEIENVSLSKAIKTGKTAHLSWEDKRAVEIAKQVLDSEITSSMSAVEKVKAIHDYIVLHTAYDTENYNAGTIPDIDYRPAGVLLNGKAVCQGYAEAFQMFMEVLGIPCKYVSGTAGGGRHGWNMVELEGEWYHLDATWDDPTPDKEGFVRYDYFLIPDSVMLRDHSWNREEFPSCDSIEYLYYTDQAYIVDSISNFLEKFLEQYREGKRTIIVMYPEYEYPDWDLIREYTRHFSYYDLRQKGDYYILRIELKD